MTDQRTNAVIDREDARVFRIACRLDAPTFRMLQDIEQHVRIDSRRAPDPPQSKAPSGRCTGHCGPMGPRSSRPRRPPVFSQPVYSWPEVPFRP